MEEYISILSREYRFNNSSNPHISIENYIISHLSKLFPCLHKTALIDVTFQPSSVMKLLKLYYSECIFIDLEHDDINYLEYHLQLMQISSTMRQTLTLAFNENNFGQTLLHRACKINDLARVEWLLTKMNARVDVKDLKGCNVLHRAIQFENDSSDCVRLLMNTTPRVNGSITECKYISL
jgi:hypothetical protein